MSDPTAGTVLGEEVRNQLRALMFRGDPAFASDADEVLDRIEPVIAFLISATQEAAEGRDQARLLDLLADVAAKATPYGEQDGGFVATYILPTGPIHRILAALGEHGRPVPLPPGETPTLNRIKAGIREIDSRQPDGPVWPQAPLPDEIPRCG